jgi:hypothetical protein
MSIFQSLKRFLSGDVLPDLEEYGIQPMPRRNVQVKEDRRAEGQVLNGTEFITKPTEDGTNTIETVQANRPPETSNDVVLDGFDLAYLEEVVGSKWAKDEGRAKVIKWYWLKSFSARQIEQEKTDKTTKKLERGYSERAVADYIKAYYEADDEREKAGKPRQRSTRSIDVEEEESPAKIVTWE